MMKNDATTTNDQVTTSIDPQQIVDEMEPQSPTKTKSKKKTNKKKAETKPEWELGYIIDRDTFMSIDFPKRADYCVGGPPNAYEVDIALENLLDKLNMSSSNMFYFLQNCDKIRKTGSLKWLPKMKTALIGSSRETVEAGLKDTLRWMGLYSVIYTAVVHDKKKTKQIIEENGIIGDEIVKDFVKLIKKEQKIGFLPISKCIIAEMEKQKLMNNKITEKIPEEQGEQNQNMKEIENMRNLLDIVEKHFCGELTPQNIAYLKENVKNWEKDIEKLSEMLNNLPNLDLEQEVSSK